VFDPPDYSFRKFLKVSGGPYYLIYIIMAIFLVYVIVVMWIRYG
jgi:uncharacterized membrane protein